MKTKDFKVVVSTYLNDSFFSNCEFLAETKADALKILAEQKEIAKKSGVMFEESSVGMFVGMKNNGNDIWDFYARVEINF